MSARPHAMCVSSGGALCASAVLAGLAGLAGLVAIVASPSAHANGFTCTKPYNYSGTITIPANYAGNTLNITVPLGYRLQLEYISGTQRMQTAADSADFSVVTNSDGTNVSHTLPVRPGFATIDRTVSQPVLLYARNATDILVRWGRSVPDYTRPATGDVHLSGCLVATGR